MDISHCVAVAYTGNAAVASAIVGTLEIEVFITDYTDGARAVDTTFNIILAC